jgi:DNA-binding Xre family transcriptional regulator
MNIEDRIKQLAGEKEIPLKTLATKIDMTETGFYAMLRNKSMKVETLLKISKVLSVEPGSFSATNPQQKWLPRRGFLCRHQHPDIAHCGRQRRK